MRELVSFMVMLAFLCSGSYWTHVAGQQNESQQKERLRVNRSRKRISESDYTFLRLAMDIAKCHRLNDTARSGTIIVKNGEVIGRGWTQSHVLTDSSSHPEMMAVHEACRYLGSTSLAGCTIYSSEVPCPLCLSLLYMTVLDKIIYTESPNVGNLTAEKELNKNVYQSLMRKSSERYNREMVIPLKDFE